MNLVEQTIQKIIQQGEGNVLAIGTSPSMNQALETNDQITICDVLSKDTQLGKRRFLGRRTKPFPFRKLRKKFKKKQKDMIIGNIQELQPYLKTFIRDSIYITKGTIYLYSTQEYEMDLLMKRYHRFLVKTNIKKCTDGSIVTIEVNDAKNNWWKEKMYYIIDTITDIVDMIGDALIN